MSAFQAEDGGSIPLTRSFMKYLFFVQGEGRGHLIQALTLKEQLEEHGHQVLAFVVGLSKNKKLPKFFISETNIPLFTINSPGFTVNKNKQGINLGASVLDFVIHIPKYYQSLKKIKKIVNKFQPDILINFYETLTANYFRLYHEKRPLFCIGHQYFIEHPAFKFPSNNQLNKLSFKLLNRITTTKNSIKIALSFSKELDQKNNNLMVCPPLIRKEIKEKKVVNNNFFLVYLLNAGYSEEITAWHQKHPDHRIEAFWDREEQKNLDSKLHFHCLSGKKFVDLLASCQAYISTAGFDSISEAAYLQKNILMVPTKNHFEQKCNAKDAERVGLAINADNFDLSLIIDKTKNRNEAAFTFKKWVDEYSNKIVKILEQ